MLISLCISTSLLYFTAGIFYTGFLSGYGMDIVNVTILGFVPSIAGMLVLFAPELLTHFKRRRWILGVCKFLYYFLIFVVLTILPKLVTDNTGRMTGLIIITFFANLFNVFATAGYAAWHIKFMPDNIRSYYLSFSQFFAALIAGILVLLSGVISDALAEMAERQLSFIVTMRYVAFILGLIDVICLLIPHEVEYPLIHAPRLSDIFSVPVRNRKFMMTMVIMLLFQFAESLYGSSLTFYLLDTIHISYVFYNVIILAYSIFFPLFMTYWRRKIDRYSWFSVFAMCMLIVGPLQILYGFVQPDKYILLICLVRLPQHFAGVGHNVIFANFPYINMPDTNRTCYSSFSQIVVQIGALCGTLFASFFHAAAKTFSFTAFGYTYVGGMPWLLFLCGVIELLIAAYIFIFKKQLEPNA